MKTDSELVALFNVPDIKVLVPTLWLLNNCMRDDYYNAHIIMKYKTVENYFNGDSRQWWDIYKLTFDNKKLIDIERIKC